MKKDKTYELRIEEDDEISGIDSISLVSEPAIEINWVAFNKVKAEDFHIPDGEDDKYIQKLVATAQNEQELFDEGWVVDSVEILDGKNSFISTNPNGPSIEDELEYNVRYKYILNPRISGQGPIINTTRDFCKTLINRNYVWRVEDMEATQNDFGQAAMVWRGGYNCRHVWSRIKYTKDATIVNKASVNKGKVEVNGFPNDLVPDTRVLGYSEPDTVTNKTLANPSPSTIRNLGLSKEKMEIDDQNVNVFGYHTRYFALCPSAQELFRHLVTMEVDEDTQGMIRSAARAADNVFRIEIEVVKSEESTQHQYEEALISVDDMDDIMFEVDKIVGMEHDLSFMDDHIELISEYLKEDLGYDNNLPPFVDQGIRRRKRKKKRNYAEVGPRGGIKESPKAPKSDTPNPDPKGEGTAEGDASGKRGAKVTEEQEKTLQNKVDEFNEKESNTKNGRATLGSLKSVFQRGLGAFNTSHSPKVQSAEQWAYARVNAFLYLLKNGRPENPKYDTDYDLLPKEHPKYVKNSKVDFESYSDYPDSVKNNAKAVLKYVDENGWGSCGTDVGKQRANQLANGEAISEDTIRRMYSYLSRHKVDLESSKGYGDGCGKLMYDSWGGLSALSWSESKIKSIDKEKMSKQMFQADDEKRIVVGPAMVPDLKIFRKDKKGNPYYVTFKADTIKMIMEKYMRNKYTDNNDTEHDGKAADDVYVIESWIKEDKEDKSNKYGFEDLPVGTWFVSMKVRNDEVWQKIKNKELNGFSVSGYFEEIEQFYREQEFLREVAKIIKDL